MVNLKTAIIFEKDTYDLYIQKYVKSLEDYNKVIDKYEFNFYKRTNIYVNIFLLLNLLFFVIGYFLTHIIVCDLNINNVNIDYNYILLLSVISIAFSLHLSPRFYYSDFKSIRNSLEFLKANNNDQIKLLESDAFNFLPTNDKKICLHNFFYMIDTFWIYANCSLFNYSYDKNIIDKYKDSIKLVEKVNQNMTKIVNGEMINSDDETPVFYTKKLIFLLFVIYFIIGYKIYNNDIKKY